MSYPPPYGFPGGTVPPLERYLYALFSDSKVDPPEYPTERPGIPLPPTTPPPEPREKQVYESVVQAILASALAAQQAAFQKMLEDNKPPPPPPPQEPPPQQQAPPSQAPPQEPARPWIIPVFSNAPAPQPVYQPHPQYAPPLPSYPPPAPVDPAPGPGPTNINVTSVNQQKAEKPPPPKKPPNYHNVLMCSLLFMYLWFVSIMIFSVGVTIYVLGSMAYYDEERLMEWLYPEGEGNLSGFNKLGLLHNMANGLMWTGVFIGLVGFFGCFGLLCGHNKLVMIFSWILLVSAVIQTILLLIIFFGKDKIFDTIESKLKDTVRENYDGQPNSTSQQSRLIDAFMILNRCCGITSPDDFIDTIWYRNRTDLSETVPFSCCELNNTHSYFNGRPPFLVNPNCTFANYTTETDLPNYVGVSCISSYRKTVDDNTTILLQLAILILVLQFISVLCVRSAAAQIVEHEKLEQKRKQAAAMRGLD
jgi:hypothetical protein